MIKTVNKLKTYIIWLIISLLLLFLFKDFLLKYSLIIILVLLAKDILWDIIGKKYSTPGFEHLPFLAVIIIAHLLNYIALSKPTLILFIFDFVLDLLNDLRILPYR